MAYGGDFTTAIAVEEGSSAKVNRGSLTMSTPGPSRRRSL
jgi:hypothetical protein